MKKILIVGYFGFDNFGDEALLHVLIKDLIKVGFKKEDITVLSNNSTLTLTKHNVKSINRWNFIEVLNELLGNNVIIFTGGLFQDVSSFQSFIYYSLILITAKITGKQTVFYGVGIGPFKRKITRLLFNLIARNITFISTRDQISANILPHSERSIVSCDPVWSIEIDETAQKKIPNIDWNLPVLGVSMKLNPNLKQNLLDIISDKLVKIINGMKDWQILLIPCMPAQDLPVLYELYDQISPKASDPKKIIILENFSNFSVNEQAGILASCNAVIGMRYHGLLAPMLNAKPVLGIVFDYKIKSLLDYAKQVNIMPKDDFENPWNYFWQNIEGSTTAAKIASENAKLSHNKNIDMLKKLYNSQ